MMNVREDRAAILVIAVTATALACRPAPLDDLELLAHIEEFENAVAGQPRDVVQEMLRDQASDSVGRLVNVRSAVVTSTYSRNNPSKIYFGVNYDEEDHVFLSEINPQLDASLKNHRHWVSIAVTYPSRQLSYELPIDQATFERLAPGNEVSFSCRIAALIRGKSVYCVPEVLNVVEK